jgi:uncharacterized protein YndB with AHSA1/START domain
MSDSTSVQSVEQEITITRVLDAPRELVFKAWTDPDQVAKWFGPAGFDTPRDSVEIDLRVGGRFHLRMVQGSGGMEYGLRYEIVELAKPELLVLKSEPMPEVGLHHSTVTRIELEADGAKTRLTLTDGPYPEPGGRGAAAGWEQSFDKLDALLAIRD